MRISGLIAAASFLMLAGNSLHAQSIASRVAAVRDGKVRMTFASRDDICGFNNGISTTSRNRTNNRSSWSGDRSEDVEYDVECSEGPARVVVEKSAGRVTSVRAYVGGRWRASSNATDLGAVSTREATDWLLSLASSASSRVSGSAIFAMTLADSVRIAPSLARFAENEGNPDEAREQAIFWLGQTRGESTELLRGLYSRLESEKLRDKVIFSLSQQRGVNDEWLLALVGNPRESIEMRKKALFWAGQGGAPISRLASIYSRITEKEMKDQMIFVFSQRRESAAVEKLMDIARNDPDRDARRKALFWLGQSKDPRVATMLSDIINR